MTDWLTECVSDRWTITFVEELRNQWINLKSKIKINLLVPVFKKNIINPLQLKTWTGTVFLLFMNNYFKR